MTDVDSLLYVDTDVLFTSPVEELWSHFDKFNSTQLAALAPEHEQEWQETVENKMYRIVNFTEIKCSWRVAIDFLCIIINFHNYAIKQYNVKI